MLLVVAIACSLIVLASLVVLAVLARGAANRAGRLFSQVAQARPEVARLQESVAALQSATAQISRR